jgi:hypothetical protein
MLQTRYIKTKYEIIGENNENPYFAESIKIEFCRQVKKHKI